MPNEHTAIEETEREVVEIEATEIGSVMIIGPMLDRADIEVPIISSESGINLRNKTDEVVQPFSRAISDLVPLAESNPKVIRQKGRVIKRTKSTRSEGRYFNVNHDAFQIIDDTEFDFGLVLGCLTGLELNRVYSIDETVRSPGRHDVGLYIQYEDSGVDNLSKVTLYLQGKYSGSGYPSHLKSITRTTPLFAFMYTYMSTEEDYSKDSTDDATIKGQIDIEISDRQAKVVTHETFGDSKILHQVYKFNTATNLFERQYVKGVTKQEIKNKFKERPDTLTVDQYQALLSGILGLLPVKKSRI